jgi:hypothetical protein
MTLLNEEHYFIVSLDLTEAKRTQLIKMPIKPWNLKHNKYSLVHSGVPFWMSLIKQYKQM